MSHEVVRRDRARVLPLGGGRYEVVGTTDQIEVVLRWARDQGRLARATRMQPHGPVYSIELVLADHPRRPAVTTRPWFRRPRFLVAVLVGVVAFLVALGWALYLLISAMVAVLPALIGIVLLLLIVGGLSGGGKTFSGTFQGKIH